MIRSILEGMCARWATEHITPEQIEQLEEIVLLSEFHLKKDKDKVVQVSDLDGKFHHVLYEDPTAGLWNIRYRTFINM